VVEEAVELYAPVAETKDINLHNHTPKALSVYADADALSTILRNLVNNALKYTSSQERVDIQAHLSGGYVEIQVKDNGVGIDSERIAQLFSINHTSTTGTAGEKGAGLGLTLCKELALLNQGDIRVESEPGKGSTFILRLPANP
jgi:signal transduction histidine kinase